MNRKYSVIIAVCLLYVFGIFASLCEAKIDPEKIIGIWLLDEGEGNVATDASENGYDGAITNSDWVDGQFDGALDIIVDSENKFTFFEIYVSVYDYGIFNRFTQACSRFYQ